MPTLFKNRKIMCWFKRKQKPKKVRFVRDAPTIDFNMYFYYTECEGVYVRGSGSAERSKAEKFYHNYVKTNGKTEKQSEILNESEIN